MKKVWKQLGVAVATVLMMALLLTVTVFAEGLSGDNSLSDLGLENGTATPEFEYSVWEYDVKVAPGTTELTLNPVPSDANAQILSIEGTTLGEDGTTTVTITVQAENGETFPYTLHVSTDETAAPVNETEAPQTETPQTEAPQTENQQVKELEATNKLLRSQSDEYKNKSEMQMKIIYGLIALAVILIFVIVNQLLRNKDLKEDLREIENHIDSHSKEKAKKSDTYYAPQQGRGVPKYVQPVNNGNYQEETFRQVEKDSDQEDKAAARKQAKADKKAARAEAKAAKKAGKFEQQPGNEQQVNAMNRPQNNGNVPPMSNQMGNGMNGSQMGGGINAAPVRQPQGGVKGQMGRQPQNGMNVPPMNNQMGNMSNMGPYVGRQSQAGAQPNASQTVNRQPVQGEVQQPQEPTHSKVEVDMIDL